MTRGTHRAAPRARTGLPRTAFTVVDEVTCYFDTEHEPANIHMEMRIPHPLDRRRFRAAALAALAASPRACSRRARTSPMRRGYEWERPAELDIDPVSFTTFASTEELIAQRIAFIARSPSIDASPPALLLVATGPDCGHVILNAHHATMDGISWLEVLRDIGRRYRGEEGPGVPDEAGPAGADPVASRSEPAPPPPTRAGEVSTADSTEAAERPGRGRAGRPARIAAEGGGQRGLGLHMMLLPGVPAVRSSGTQPAPTLNDALIAALILAIGRWNTEHARPARAVRITVPVNARTTRDASEGNLTRLVTIAARPPAPGGGSMSLLLDVARQTRQAREQSGAQVGPGTRGIAAAWCPAPAKRWLVRTALRTVGPLVCDTVMLTNLGNMPDPPDFGGGGVVTMAVSGPAQMPRGMSVATITAGGQPQIALRYNRLLLSDDAAVRFGALFRQAIAEFTVAPDAPAAGLLNLDWSGPNSVASESLRARSV